MSEDWSISEVIVTVSTYFDMLNLELAHIPYNKSEFRRRLLPQLKNRSEGAIEFKHQNISAVLANAGRPFIKGYKPLMNYQQLLVDEVEHYLQERRSMIEPKFEQFAMEPVSVVNSRIDYSKLLGDRPESSLVSDKDPTYRAIKVNYLEREQNNRSLGEKGEELIISYERFRLKSIGKEYLANSIEWTAQTEGDGTGFDILSKNEDGTDRYIEVKTTKLTKETPIFLTHTELKFANANSRNFYLYRVYNYNDMPKFFIQQGEYGNHCYLKPQTYRGYFR